MLAALMDSRLLLPFIFLLCSLVCVFFLFFSAAFETEKMMKKPACWEFVLILGFHCLQGRRQWQSQYSSLCIAALLFSPSLYVLFLSLDLCYVFPLFFSPVSPSVARGCLCPAFIRPETAPVVVTVSLLNTL
jgi:hypothetical protein